MPRHRCPFRPWTLACLAAAIAAGGGARVEAAPRDQQVALAAAGAVKVVVRGQGWLRVTQPELVAAGLSPNVNPANLQLFADGVEQALRVTGNGDGTFSADEALELYGVGRDTRWTDARTYWLVAGQAGARVPLATPATGAAAPTSFIHDERLIEHKNYVSSVRNGEVSNFFGDGVAATPVAKTIAAHHLDAAAAGSAVLRVGLQGLTATTHQVDVSFNGQLLGTATLGDRVDATFAFSAPNVVEGDNHVTLVSHGASDLSVIDGLTLSYPHTYAADGDALAFTAPAATRVALTGFSAPTMRVVDVTDASRPVELAVTPTTVGAASTASFDTPAATSARTLIAFLPANVGHPASVAADAPSTWTASHDGELVILSHASFLSALAPLVARRRQEGWAVQLVDVQDVYDELGGGDETPFAIRDFLQTARGAWRVPPRFVLLVGDASFDPRNFLGVGAFDLLPTKLVDTAEMETASDDWYADADLDGVPELGVGRWPARTPAQVATFVQKTLDYAGTADLPRGGLFVTDVDDVDLDFEGASAVSEDAVKDLMPVTDFKRGQAGNTSDALLTKLDEGPFLVNYFGHGSVEVWDDLFTSAQAATLTNGHPSIYVVMNCLNGFFHDLYTTSLAESLLEAPNGGAVAVWASSTLAEFTPQPAYNKEFLMHLGRTALGETARLAKQATDDTDARRTWILFGDPTLFGTPTGALGPGADAGSDAAAPSDARADGGLDEAGVDASAPDAGATAMDAGAPPRDAMAGDDATMVAGAASDAASAPDATSTDGAASTDAKVKSPPSSDAGCGCALDASSSRGPGGLGLLLLAGVATLRRRGRPARRARRGLAGLVALALSWLAFAPSAHAAYGYRMALTIDRTRIGTSAGATTLANYPLLINITSSLLANGGGGHVQNVNGYDIAFTGADTATCGGPATCTFNYEIESYNSSTGQVIAWVKLPSLKTAASSSNTVIYIKYGDATISAPTQNVNGTWDSNYKGVWHLNQSPVTTQTDSTTTGASSTAAGSPTPTTTTGLIGSGVNTSSTTGTGYFDYRSTTFNWASAGAFTYSGWFNTTDTVGPLLSQRDNAASNPDIDIMVGYDGVTRAAGKLLALVRDDTGAAYAEVVGSTSVNDGAWHQFTLTRTGSTIQLFLDGTSLGTASAANSGGSITTGGASGFQSLGREGNWISTNYGSASTDDRYLAATFDEYRISNSVRNSDWLTTDYNTQSAPASTFTAGAEALASCGDGTVGTGETCDDGNIVSGDGCSGTCAVEAGYSCSGTPSTCTTICGDGLVGGAEGCDDGNLTNGDGCSSTCTVEATYHCAGTAPSVCTFAQFDYYKRITINKPLVGTATAPTTLTSYPVLISVTDPNLRTIANGGHVRNASAFDLVFRGGDTTTCAGPSNCGLAHEIEKYVPTTGQLVAWVQLPGLRTQTASSSTIIAMYYGNMAISTSTQQATSVWDTSFKSVWHLHQDPTGTSPAMKDATSNGNDGTSVSLTAAATAKIGAGVTTDGSTSYMSFNSGTSLNAASGSGFTYSTWLNTTDTFGGILSLRSAATGNPVIDIMVGFDGSMTSSASLLALVRDDTGSLGDINGGTINDGAWHLVTVTRSGTTISLYVDKTLKGTTSDGGVGITTDIRNMGREGYWTTITPGYTSVGNEFLAASFDEVRASSTARTIDWVTTDYNAQSSPATFLTFAAEVATDIHTNVSLLAFDATATCTSAAIAWRTAYEVDTLGFNVYRDGAGPRTKLTPALVAGAGASGGGGHAYEVLDPAPPAAGQTYLLETVHFDLTSTWDGPVTPKSACATTPPSPSTSVANASTSPAPVGGAGESAMDLASRPDGLGGCAIGAPVGHGRWAAALALALVALARRRRRR